MTVLFSIIGLIFMVLATGSVEADNFMIGFVCALVGISSFTISIYTQEKEKQVKLYYKED